MRVAICEDEKICSDILDGYIKRWAMENGVFAEVRSYISAEQFLYSLDDELDVDLLFLDIKMSRMNGMELARKLRERKYRMQIVFTTDSPEFVFEGYAVSALNYLMKPIKYEQCSAVMEQARAAVTNRKYYLCRTAEQLQRIPYDEIIYIEMFSHTAVIHTVQAQYSTRRTISGILSELDNTLFIRCHKSFVVNIQHIASISRKSINLSDGSIISVGQLFVLDVNEKFIKYYKDKR